LDYLIEYLQHLGYIAEREYKFHPSRRWRFDLAVPKIKLAIEIEGGLWVMGRHTRAPGFLKDMEKYNQAAVLGWRLLRYSPQQIKQKMYEEDIYNYINNEII
jgi:very-short-patch-repair endonuclease